MKERAGQRIKLTSYNELLGVENEQTAIDLDIEKIKSFRNHPYYVREDMRMKELYRSVKENGIITPVLVRPLGDEYEMISGHRRKFAAEHWGMKTIPAIIREMTDEEATIAMVDANLQREEILPSEKAFAFRMKLEAIKRQGSRSDLTSAHNERKLEAADVIAEEVSESRAQIRRYIRLTELLPELLKLVDDKRLSLLAAVELSYVDKTVQKWLSEYIKMSGTINQQQAKKIRNWSESGNFNEDQMIQFLNDLRGMKEVTGITIKSEKLKQYFPADYTAAQMEQVIVHLLEEWTKKGE